VLNGYVTETFHIAKHQLTTLIISTTQDNHRVDDLDCPHPLPQRPSTGKTARWRCAGAPPECPKPANNSAVSTVTCNYPHYVKHSNATFPPKVSVPPVTMNP
jgi:hypothetical protein